ncbi:MAG: class I SAM-dependent methyltransferase [Mesoflavibacter sp.]|nr:class I SAM-dependent methyltransferase [Mesoflavibacter sp.]
MSKEYIPALGYNWLTNLYDWAIKLTMPESKFRNRLIDYLNPQNSDTILEFGFGTGQNLIIANNRNNSAYYVGLDIDPKVKHIAEEKFKKKGLKIKLDLYDGNLFPYADNTFDKVFSSLVFHQLDKNTKSSCLNEINRVLKPDGKIIIGDWGKAKSKFMRFTFYIVQMLDGFKTTSDNVNGLMLEYMKKSGFKNVAEIDYINTKIGSYCYYTGVK